MKSNSEPENSNHDNGSNTVIIGAGIMGCATAYYLSRSGNTRPDSIYLIEASEELFASASGKAGGFLAEDWFGPATASLGELSFRLHEELARENDGGREWGYSRSTGTSLFDDGVVEENGSSGEDWLANGGSRAQAATEKDEFLSNSSEGPTWLRRRKGDQITSISSPNGVAQVNPLRLSQFLLKQSLRAGVHLHHPARPIRLDETGKSLHIRHLNSTEHRIPCTRLLITAGAWTPLVFSNLFPNAKIAIPISPYAGHSIVVRSPRFQSSKDCHAIFTSMQSGFSPEIFSRSDDEIYIAGLNSPSIPLPSLPSEAEIDPSAINQLKDISTELLGKDTEVVREALCFRPVTKSGNPILRNVDDADLGVTLPGGVFICAGHGPWGISHSLGTGKIMSEMLERRETSADVRRLGLK